MSAAYCLEELTHWSRQIALASQIDRQTQGLSRTIRAVAASAPSPQARKAIAETRARSPDLLRVCGILSTGVPHQRVLTLRRPHPVKGGARDVACFNCGSLRSASGSFAPSRDSAARRIPPDGPKDQDKPT